jgi:ATPase subunit of ABC transporter with duplicated ATPase domains
VLQAGLEQFEGTLLLVSHDRYLVYRLATQVWELRDGQLQVFPGPYAEYLAARRGTRLRGQRAPAG